MGAADNIIVFYETYDLKRGNPLSRKGFEPVYFVDGNRHLWDSAVSRSGTKEILNKEFIVRTAVN